MPEAAQPDPPAPWKTIEDEFRLWSFHVYYKRTFGKETDLDLRFVKALVASCQPIRDRRLVIDWWNAKHAKRRRKRTTPSKDALEHADAAPLPA